MINLEYFFRTGKILQTVGSFILDRHSFGKQIADQFRRCTAHHYLTAVSQGFDTGDPIHRWTEVVVIPLSGRPRMKRHPHPDGPGSRPVLLPDNKLRCKGCFDGIGSLGKSAAERIANSLKDMTVMLIDGFPEYLIVAFEGDFHGGGVVLPEMGRALDIGEEKCYRPTRRRNHGYLNNERV